MHPKHLVSNWQGAIFGVGMVVVGMLAIIYPDALADTEATGRRAFFKMLLIWAWGWPFGVILMGLGALVLGGSCMPSDEESE